MGDTKDTLVKELTLEEVKVVLFKEVATHERIQQRALNAVYNSINDLGRDSGRVRQYLLEAQQAELILRVLNRIMCDRLNLRKEFLEWSDRKNSKKRGD